MQIFDIDINKFNVCVKPINRTNKESNKQTNTFSLMGCLFNGVVYSQNVNDEWNKKCQW